MKTGKKRGDETREKRKAILAALARATGGAAAPPALEAGEADGEADYYYSLTHEEIAALISGDIEKIENWVSNLDRRHATWLLRRLIGES